ncbi:MAG: hypothetical protein RIQ68_180 [Pseudomonadota bacterium]|jgi:hypothetical protein
MLLVEANRDIFQPLASGRRYGEIGVYRGAYARGVKAFRPSQMFLIDPWRPADMSALVPSDYVGDPVTPLLETFAPYYPGGLENALEAAYQEVCAEFGADKNCHIMRATSAQACETFGSGSLDLLYIDGNHRYDYALADLERWSSKVAQDGQIILNDCYVSPIGKRQHISVLEAVSTFIKLTDWRPVALVNRPFTDVVLTREAHVKSAHTMMKKLCLLRSAPFMELPGALIHAISHKVMRVETPEKSFLREYLSFGE